MKQNIYKKIENIEITPKGGTNKKRKVLLLSLVAFLLIGGSAGGYAYYLNKQNKELILATQQAYWNIEIPAEEKMNEYDADEVAIFDSIEATRQEAFDNLDVETLNTLQEKHISLFEQVQNRLITEYITEQKEVVSNKSVKAEATDGEKQGFISAKNELMDKLSLDVDDVILFAMEEHKETTVENTSAAKADKYLDNFTKIKETIVEEINKLDNIINTTNTTVQNRLDQEAAEVQNSYNYSNNYYSDNYTDYSGGYSGGNINPGNNTVSNRPTQTEIDSWDINDCEGKTMGPDGTTCM